MPKEVSKGPSHDLEYLVRLVDKYFLMHTLTWEDFRPILKDHRSITKIDEKSLVDFKRIEAVANDVIKHKKVPEDLKAFQELVGDLNEILNLDLPLEIFSSKYTKILKHTKLFLGILLFLFTSYILIGGIATGQSTFLNISNPALLFALLLVLILLLGAFEGLQIGVTTLRLKDVSTFQNEYPKAYSLHRKFRAEEKARDFLAGRQLFVIILVFIIAQITSFPNMKTLPFTEMQFPGWTSPWFETIFLKLGIIGALFVLWLGQLGPQFIANKNPLSLLNFPGMGLTLKSAFFVDSMGLTLPGKWISQRVKKLDDIPISPIEQYRYSSMIQGYCRVGLKAKWEIGPDRAKLEYQNSTIFTHNGFRGMKDDSLEVTGNGPLLKYRYKLLSEDGTISRDICGTYPFRDERLPEGRRRFVHHLEPNYGPFLKGDVLIIENEVDFPEAYGVGIKIDMATKYVLFGIKFTGTPTRIGKVMVRINKDYSAVDESTQHKEHELKLQYDQENVPFFEFFEWYPEKDTLYSFNWEVEYN